MIKCAIFDLDGTLVNTIEDLGRAADFVLEQFGVEKKWGIEDYTRFVGNGIRVLLDLAFEHTLSDSELDKAMQLFRPKYNEILLDNSFIYDGIKETLDSIKKKGIKLAVVTNKPHDAAVNMVETLFGKGYFDVILGANEDIPKKPDPHTTFCALDKMRCKPGEAIFFGDSDVDVFTAKNAGVESVACSWGYRSFECLFAASPSVIIDAPKYIEKLF